MVFVGKNLIREERRFILSVWSQSQLFFLNYSYINAQPFFGTRIKQSLIQCNVEGGPPSHSPLPFSRKQAHQGELTMRKACLSSRERCPALFTVLLWPLSRKIQTGSPGNSFTFSPPRASIMNTQQVLSQSIMKFIAVKVAVFNLLLENGIHDSSRLFYCRIRFWDDVWPCHSTQRCMP